MGPLWASVVIAIVKGQAFIGTSVPQGLSYRISGCNVVSVSALRREPTRQKKCPVLERSPMCCVCHAVNDDKN